MEKVPIKIYIGKQGKTPFNQIRMANIEIPELLTPEIIDSIASNAESLKSALASKT